MNSRFLSALFPSAVQAHAAAEVLEQRGAVLLLTPLTVASAYMVLGATWLMFRTTGTLADASRARARAAGLGVILAVLAVVGSALGSAPRLAPK